MWSLKAWFERVLELCEFTSVILMDTILAEHSPLPLMVSNIVSAANVLGRLLTSNPWVTRSNYGNRIPDSAAEGFDGGVTGCSKWRTRGRGS